MIVDEDEKQTLRQFSSGGSSKYGKFDEKGEYEGIYLGCELQDDPFNKGEKRMMYHFIAKGGIEQEIGSKSKRLAQAMLVSNAAINDIIRISRFGKLFEMQYKVTVIKKAPENEAGNVADVKPDDVPF